MATFFISVLVAAATRSTGTPRLMMVLLSPLMTLLMTVELLKITLDCCLGAQYLDGR
jgi:hypothetical protein